jgi:hypothetical protein
MAFPFLFLLTDVSLVMLTAVVHTAVIAALASSSVEGHDWLCQFIGSLHVSSRTGFTLKPFSTATYNCWTALCGPQSMVLCCVAVQHELREALNCAAPIG